MPTYAVYLRPKSSYASSMGSDTLFGALCWALRALMGPGTLEEMIKRFILTSPGHTLPPFAISSAFPFLHHKGLTVRLYPKPLIAELTHKQVTSLAQREKQRKPELGFQQTTVKIIEKGKRIKSASHLSEELFEQVIHGKADAHELCKRLVEHGSEDSDIVRFGNALITHGERKKVHAEEMDAFLAEADVQHNEIERVTLATVEGRLFFAQEKFLHRHRAGLWFAIRTDDLEFINPLLRYLADTGFGGDRSVGKGHFNIPINEIHEHTLPFADTPNCFVTLSRYIPVNGECNFSQEPLSYSVTTIRPKHESKMAYIGHHTYKGLLRVFEPGSFFPLNYRKQVYGQLVPVGSNSDTGGIQVYHSGLIIPVFAKIGGVK